MKVLVAGGTGLIGSALASSLVQEGHTVTILSRDPSRVKQNYQGVSWESSDLIQAVSETDAIINLAGESLAGSNPLLMRWTEQRKRRIRDSRIKVGAALVEALKEAQAKPITLIQASAIGYYGNSGGGHVDEASPAGSDFLAQVCLEWEDSTQAAESLGLRRAVIRIGLVLSPQGGLLSVLALPFRFFLGGRLGSGQQFMSWIHINDVVRAMIYILDNPQLQGVFNLTSPEPVTNQAFAQELGSALKRPAWFAIPNFALKLLLGEAATLALDGRQVLPARLQRTDFRFQFPEIAPALEDLLA